MTTQELIEKYEAAISRLKSPGVYGIIEFGVGTGQIYNHVGLTYAYEHKEFLYSTDGCGDAYFRRVGVDCRLISSDEDGNLIYETLDGIVFKERYTRGNPSSFDYIDFLEV